MLTRPSTHIVLLWACELSASCHSSSVNNSSAGTLDPSSASRVLVVQAATIMNDSCGRAVSAGQGDDETSVAGRLDRGPASDSSAWTPRQKLNVRTVEASPNLDREIGRIPDVSPYTLANRGCPIADPRVTDPSGSMAATPLE